VRAYGPAQKYAPQLAAADLYIGTFVLCRWRNATGTQIWPDYGSMFGAFPENSKQKLFYAFLLKHMFKQHGYIPGVNFFIIPYDWRTGIQGLEQVCSSTSCGLCKCQEDCSSAAIPHTRWLAERQCPCWLLCIRLP
jgi:hypothetical protein